MSKCCVTYLLQCYVLFVCIDAIFRCSKSQIEILERSFADIVPSSSIYFILLTGHLGGNKSELQQFSPTPRNLLRQAEGLIGISDI